MNRLAIVLFLALSLAVANATIHTMCFDYFLKKDKCINGAAGPNIRCGAKAKPHPKPVSTFVLQGPSKKTRTSGKALERRYDTNEDVLIMASGEGICGRYDSEKQDGVCLWSGPEQDHPTIHTAGWLNSLKTSNCGKQVYIQRRGSKKVFYVPVLDGCGFHKTKVEEGCFEIGVTHSLAKKLAIHPNELGPHPTALVGGFTWDFNNLDGKNPRAGPV
ncbi:hypothetical protein PTTG_27566 [Puccinia triticina 1-1 BBBD Race 1]|uniref:Secreted protein n=2 Tax=Puccinia triticina TaxID=208348 RepID=A0A180GJA1_PUCT1|nr:uncharacterized protein PtA15_2A877 [Puccinia triticina]OAV92604.1 hypothetical protein PTTG_27566 [Puccinia triticina 1-1 BBBD Race 1]WAQ82560.1 hypothetical protein PtA15_2A877 [Puccinia triticina]